HVVRDRRLLLRRADAPARPRPGQSRHTNRHVEPGPLGCAVAYPGDRAPGPDLSFAGAVTSMEERPRNLKAMLSEAKDTSELMVDLAYTALYFGDPDMAEEVSELEEQMSALIHDMRSV